MGAVVATIIWVIVGILTSVGLLARSLWPRIIFGVPLLLFGIYNLIGGFSGGPWLGGGKMLMSLGIAFTLPALALILLPNKYRYFYWMAVLVGLFSPILLP